jgi:GNAT superfamily N-acetyltransferase
VGYAASAFNPDSSTGEMQGFIFDLYVIPQWRRRGIGRALQSALEQRFAGAGIRKIKLIGDLHNAIALQMAVRSGYRPEGLIGVKEWQLTGAR